MVRIILSHQWGCELDPLAWKSCRMGFKACMFIVWGCKSSRTGTEFPGQKEPLESTLQDHVCRLFSCHFLLEFFFCPFITKYIDIETYTKRNNLVKYFKRNTSLFNPGILSGNSALFVYISVIHSLISQKVSYHPKLSSDHFLAFL